MQALTLFRPQILAMRLALTLTQSINPANNYLVTLNHNLNKHIVHSAFPIGKSRGERSAITVAGWTPHLPATRSLIVLHAISGSENAVDNHRLALQNLWATMAIFESCRRAKLRLGIDRHDLKR